jgi:acetyl/propionyl-CoA carboxylase alpha subunit
LLAKLSVWSDTRTSAIERMRRAVDEFRVLGITTNLPLFTQLMSDEAWLRGALHTGFLDEFMQRYSMPRESHEKPHDSLVAVLLAVAAMVRKGSGPAIEGPADTSAWRASGRQRLLR